MDKRAKVSRQMKAHAALIHDLARHLNTTYSIANAHFQDLREAKLVKRAARGHAKFVSEARKLIIKSGRYVALAAPLIHDDKTYPPGFIVDDYWLPAPPKPTPKPPTTLAAPPPLAVRPPAPLRVDPSLAASVKIMMWALRKIGSTALAREAFERAVVALAPRKEAVGG